MLIEMMKSKIHRATVTDANVNYIGSVTIDARLMEAAKILPNQKLQVVDVTNGARLETYAIKGKRGSGIICLNGAAAHLINPGDIVIIIGYCLIDIEEAKNHKPTVVFVDDENKITDVRGTVS